MTDFDYDNLQKKRIARSAHNHINARRGKCRLPHENLTKKELNAMNGEVYTVNLTKPITWDEWKALTPGMQETYYNNLVTTYGVGMSHIAKLFGVSDRGIANYANRNGLTLLTHKVGERIPKDKLFQWHEFLRGDAPDITDVKEEEPVEDVAERIAEEVVEEPVGGLSSFSMTFAPGTLWADVMGVLAHVPLPDGATIKVVVE